MAYTLEDLGISSVRILGLCDSATPMWIFSFFGKYTDVNSGWHLSLKGTGKDMGLESCQEVGV